MLDLCMFAEGSKNEQEISIIGEDGKVWYTYNKCPIFQMDMCNKYNAHFARKGNV